MQEEPDGFEEVELDDESFKEALNTYKESNDIPKIKSGERYSPRQLYAATTNHLEGVGKYTGISEEGQNHETFIKSEQAKDSIVVPPCTDNPTQTGFLITNKNGDPYSIKDALEESKAASSNDKDYIISVKVGQNRPMFKIFGFEFGPRRNHWTHLKVERKDNKIKATHTDSKGFLGRLYSLDHIKEAVQEVFGQEVKFDSKYTGRQGVFDDKNCGRFAAAYEEATLNSEATEAIDKNPLQYANTIINLDKKCNEYVKKQREKAEVSVNNKSSISEQITPNITPIVQKVQGLGKGR